LPVLQRPACRCASLVLALALSSAAIPAASEDSAIVPDFGQVRAPSGAAAGTTGYVSSNTKPKAKKSTKAKTPPSVITARTQPVGQEVTNSVVRRPKPKRIEDDPYTPAGISAGSFTLRPSLEIAEGYDDNPFRVQNGKGSWFTLLNARMHARSNWLRHELEGELRGAFTKYTDVDNNDRPEAEARLRGRIDVNTERRIEWEARALLSTQAAGTPESITSAKRPPLVYTYGANAGYVQRFNRFEAGFYGSVERSTYEDAKLLNGTTQDQSDRNYTSYGARLRGSYESMQGVKPFAEVSADTRVFDEEVDSGGFRRSSDGIYARVGSEYELRGYLTGSFSVGYGRRTYDDPLLPAIGGLMFDSSLVWQMSGLTKVSFKAISEISETTLAGASGALKREATLTVDHAFRRWLVGSAGVSYGTYDYKGIDRSDDKLGFSASLTYYPNRYMALKGEYRRDIYHSSTPGQDYTSNIYLLSLKLQR
jgi:hypothetical protein